MTRIYFFCLLLLTASCSEKKPASHAAFSLTLVSKNDSNLRDNNDTLLYKGKKFEGRLYELYPNNSDTFLVADYVNGLLHGPLQKYYPDHKILEYRVYLYGAKNGKQISYWENGNKRFEFTAKDDTYEGELNEWAENGSLFHLAHFKNGQEEGAQKMWYDNGKIKANYVIRDGRRYGLLGTKNCTNVSDNVFLGK